MLKLTEQDSWKRKKFNQAQIVGFHINIEIALYFSLHWRLVSLLWSVTITKLGSLWMAFTTKHLNRLRARNDKKQIYVRRLVEETCYKYMYTERKATANAKPASKCKVRRQKPGTVPHKLWLDMKGTRCHDLKLGCILNTFEQSHRAYTVTKHMYTIYRQNA